ncbi:MAG: response regulator [Verrucomicrobiota bacterium]|jgi:DNA-binding NarL/FixJ family response regulator
MKPHGQVYVSCKVTDDAGHPTPDSRLAKKVFTFLTRRGIDAFLSTISLQRMGESDFQRTIDNALESAKVMIVVGTSASNLDSRWVRYEWSSFLNEIISNRKREGEIFVYTKGLHPHQLPFALRQKQCILHGEKSLVRLYEFVRNALGTPAIRILLADDHTLVRAGIRALLEKLPGVEVADEASDGREVLDLIKTHHPDVVVMDISMPGLNGLQALARITRDFPQVRVIILSMHPNDEYVLQALKSGASGYLFKRAATAELPAALKSVVGGEIYLSRELSTRLRNQLPLQRIAHARNPAEQLTARQREILQLIADGQTTKAIALTLKVSDKTVEYHRAKLMQQLNIFDIPGLVRFALQSGLIAQES